MPDRSRRRSSRHRRRGQGRSGVLALRLGIRTRERRRALRLTQAQLGERAGIAQTSVSLLERGKGGSYTLETWASVAAALGFELAAYFEGGMASDAPLDIEHLRRQQLVVATARGGGWVASVEHQVRTIDGRRLVIDVLLERADGEVLVVEVWNWLADVGRALRNHTAKIDAVRHERPGVHVSGLFVLRDTTRNRQLVGELGDVFAAHFAAASDRAVASLASADMPMPHGVALAWTDARAAKLRPARLRRSRPPPRGGDDASSSPAGERRS